MHNRYLTVTISLSNLEYSVAMSGMWVVAFQLNTKKGERQEARTYELYETAYGYWQYVTGKYDVNWVVLTKDRTWYMSQK